MTFPDSFLFAISLRNSWVLEWAVRLYPIHPRLIRLDAAYWRLRLIAWIYTALGAVAVIPWNPKRQKNRSCLPPTWTKEELGKRSAIERFFGRVFLFFHLQRPPLWGWSAIAAQVALTYAACMSRLRRGPENSCGKKWIASSMNS